MPDTTRANSASYDPDRTPRLITAQIAGNRPSPRPATNGVEAAQPGGVVASSCGEAAAPVPGAIHIPNDFIRALRDFALYLQSQGADQDSQIARLRRTYNLMSPMSRESAAQLLDFIFAILSPLAQFMRPSNPRKRSRT